MKLLSVILPVYNAEKYIFEAMGSILNQSFTDFELIVINDGSTDRSIDVIKEFNDDRIVLVEQENMGLIDTLNLALRLSKGKYIARMDADDVAHPKRFQFQLQAFKENKNLVLCSAGIEAFEKNGAHKKRYYPLSDSDIRSEFLYNSSIVHPLSMFVGDVVRKNKIEFDNNYKFCEDYKFFYDLSRYGQVENIPRFLLSYRVLPSSQTSLGVSDSVDRYMKISEIHQHILKDYDIELSNSWLQLHYRLSLSSEIEKLEIKNDVVEQILDYSRFLVSKIRFNKKLSTLSLEATIGEKFLKIILFHKRKVEIKVLSGLLFHRFTFIAVFKRLIKILRYEW